MSGAEREIGVYISRDTLAQWREDAEQRASRADSHLVFAERIVRLIDALEAPCGSCHPCNNWANQTWVNAGERLPHVHEWQEMRAERDAAYDAGAKAERERIAQAIEASVWCKCADAYCTQRATIRVAARIARTEPDHA